MWPTRVRRDWRAKRSGDGGVQAQRPGVLPHDSRFVILHHQSALNEDPGMQVYDADWRRGNDVTGAVAWRGDASVPAPTTGGLSGSRSGWWLANTNDRVVSWASIRARGVVVEWHSMRSLNEHHWRIIDETC